MPETHAASKQTHVELEALVEVEVKVFAQPEYETGAYERKGKGSEDVGCAPLPSK